MPRLRLLLFASLSANVLLGVFGWQRYAAGGNEEATPEEAVAETPALRSDSLTEWQMLVRDATDEEFVARLRREGFPPRVIREWLKRRLWMRFADRSRVLGLDAPPVPYWLKVNPVDGAEIERRTKRAALAQENTYQLRELLGVDLYCLPGDAAYDNRERLYGDLSLEKIAGIEAIKDDYRSLSDTIQMTSHGTPFPEIRAQLKLLEQQQRADIARLLTPAELEQYERRSSWTAEILQWDLGHFNATEAEYIAMYEARRVFDDRYGVRHLSRQEEELRHAAYPELRAAYEKALGPERFDEFQLMSDDRFGELKGWVEAKGLPQERALAITRILQGADERYHALREARDLERDQRPAELRTLLEETADRIGALVGEDKLDDFMEAAGHFLPEPDPAKLQAVP